MDEKLAQMARSASRGDERPLTDQRLGDYARRVPEWKIVEEEGIQKLTRTFDFKNFAHALGFTNAVGKAAEEEGHHPVITLTWGAATVTWYTHRTEGLQENDFNMAAKTDELYQDG